MKQILFVLLVVVITTGRCPAESLPLDEAITTALKNSVVMVEAKERVEVAAAKTVAARSAWWPQINLVADWNKGRSFLTALGSIKETEVGTVGVQFRQIIYDFGRTGGQSASQLANKNALAEGVGVSSQDLELRVKLAYQQALAVRSQASVAHIAESLSRQLFHQAQHFYQQGLRPKVEVLRAESNLYSASAAVLKADNAVVLADLELARAMGLQNLGDKVPIAQPASLQRLPTLEQAYEIGLHQRSEFFRSRYEQQAAQQVTKAARSGHFPVIALSGGAGYASKYLPPDGSTWNIGITLTIPVFTGMNTSSQIRETLALERMADARLKDLYLQVATEIEAAWRSAKEVDLRYLATEKAKTAAQEQSRLALERYRQGVGSMIEASDAQLQAYRAENEQIVTDFERSTARAVFARALGQTRLSSGGKE